MQLKFEECLLDSSSHSFFTICLPFFSSYVEFYAESMITGLGAYNWMHYGDIIVKLRHIQLLIDLFFACHPAYYNPDLTKVPKFSSC